MEESKPKSKKGLLIVIAIVLLLGLAAIYFADGSSLFQGFMKKSFNKNSAPSMMIEKDVPVGIETGINNGSSVMDEFPEDEEPPQAMPVESGSSLKGGGAFIMEEEEEPAQVMPSPLY